MPTEHTPQNPYSRFLYRQRDDPLFFAAITQR